jgi:PAS domain S-box-containing protein
MEQTTDEIKRLQGCINDLISVLALPAIWSDHDPAHILSTLLDVLSGMLRLDFAYVRLNDLNNGSPIEVVRLAQRLNPASQTQHLSRAVDLWLTRQLSQRRLVVPNPIGEGEVSIALLQLGLQDEVGILVAGSRRADFPTEIENLLLRVAANQAAIGLQEARDITEHKRAEEELEQRVAERTRQLTAVKDELAEELRAMTRLHQLSTRLPADTDLQPLLEEILDATMDLLRADFGNVQLYNPKTGALEIVTYRGFRQDFLDYFASVRDEGAACGRALSRGERIIIEDVLTDPAFEPHRAIAASAGFRAVQSTPLFNRSGEPLGMISAHFRQPHRPLERELRFTDLYARQAAELIERKQAEEALRASEERFRSYFELGLIGMAITSPTQGCLEVNDELCRILGYERSELLQKTWAELTHPDDLAADVAQFNRVLAGEIDGYSLDTRWIRKDGRVIDSIMAAQCLRRADGSVDYFVGLVLDTSERKRAEEELRTAHTELARMMRVTTMGELAASIAHEVNQPLAAVVTNANASLRWLAAGTPNLEEAREALARIIRDGNRASNVIQRIREMLKKASVEKDSVDINDGIQDVLALTTGVIRANDVTLRTDLAEYLHPVQGNRVQLQQVVLNLILNGIEAMSAVADRPRELTLATQEGQLKGVHVSVQDSGGGLEPQNLERIFDAFYTTKPDGMGMGLSISRSIIEAHDGRLWATANAGPGTTFHFILPCVDLEAP